MENITAKLRYFPLGPVAGPAVPIQTSDLEAIAAEHAVLITLEAIEGKNLATEGDRMLEETMDSSLEEITQSVITITSPNEDSFRDAVREVIGKYKAPRTVYATWGSNETGKRIISEILDGDDGWS